MPDFDVKRMAEFKLLQLNLIILVFDSQ